MRELLDRPRLERFLDALGRELRVPTRLYLVGGSCAVQRGWRPSTTDVDFAAEPETRELFQAIPQLKQRLQVNVEPAAPSHFIPELPGWRERSVWVSQHGRLAVYHYDFTSQLLAKLERGHRQDLTDVEHMLEDGLVEPNRALELFEQHIIPQLFRYPAIDPTTFRSKVEAKLSSSEEGE